MQIHSWYYILRAPKGFVIRSPKVSLPTFLLCLECQTLFLSHSNHDSGQSLLKDYP